MVEAPLVRLAGVLGLGTGSALVTHILLDVSLRQMLLAEAFLGALLVLWLSRRLGPAERPHVLRRLKAGLGGGAAATATYDAFRALLLASGLLVYYQPFEAIRAFGILLVGEGRESLVWGAGILYHLANGVGFGIFYAFLLGKRGWWAGVLWALALELFMVSLYPSWLGITLGAEFLKVSILAHVFYGVVLGGFCRWYLVQRPVRA